MNKIPSVFVRDEADRTYVTEQVNPLAQWVIDGEGVPTRKYDGTCVMLDDTGMWWARREVKPGKPTPADFRPVEKDDFTGKVMGWVPIEGVQFAKYHAEALANTNRINGINGPGTYELVGPRINGNPEGFEFHDLIKHADAEALVLPGRSFVDLRSHLLLLRKGYGYEGVVFHHPDGRMAKIKAKDFRPDSESA